ncbi:MAG: hypothetical protein IPO69_04500 [Saprospiraceae bacterium]|nr:hypothetical protein [Saprospiraceae bacterium]
MKKLPVTDCSEVTQSYRYPYLDEATGATRIANGSLPASVWVGNGRTEITVTLTDACNNITTRKITVNVIDHTPPTPVCIEYTQVTVDPASCWAAVAARDLNTGSHDNCISQLHYAAALMSDIRKRDQTTRNTSLIVVAKPLTGPIKHGTMPIESSGSIVMYSLIRLISATVEATSSDESI